MFILPKLTNAPFQFTDKQKMGYLWKMIGLGDDGIRDEGFKRSLPREANLPFYKPNPKSGRSTLGIRSTRKCAMILAFKSRFFQ